MSSLMFDSLPTFCWQTLFNLVTWRVKSDSCHSVLPHFCFSGRHFLFTLSKLCENNCSVDGRVRSALHSFKLQILFKWHHRAGQRWVRDLETRSSNADAGNPASCQVYRRYLPCCRRLPYLLSEASLWFQLTCSVLTTVTETMQIPPS